MVLRILVSFVFVLIFASVASVDAAVAIGVAVVVAVVTVVSFVSVLATTPFASVDRVKVTSKHQALVKLTTTCLVNNLTAI